MAKRFSDEQAKKLILKAGAKPISNFPGNGKPWLCICLKCKKEIKPIFGNIINQGTKPCVYCAKKKIHPDDALKIMRNANLEPLEPYPGSKVKWKSRHLSCGQIVYPVFNSINNGQGGCKKCGYIQSGLKGRVSEISAIATMKKVGLVPLVPYPGSGKPWKSKCMKCKQIVSPHYGRIASGTGCGVCAGRIVVPELAIEVMLKSKLKPLVPYPGGKTKWKSECLKCGKTVYPKYGDIRQGDGGCKYCGGNYVSAEEAEKIMLNANIKPLEPYKNSGTKWKSLCLVCKKNIQPTYNYVQQKGSGCKYCAKIFIDAEDAIKVMRAAKLEPLEPYPTSQKPWRCKCLRCGREVTPAYTQIQSGQKGCVYCGGKKVDPDEAFAFMKSKGLTPLEPYKRADGPWKCRCIRCLKIVTPAYSAIRQGQGGCVYCAGKKVDPLDAKALFLENNLKPLEPFVHTDKKWKSKCLKCKRIVSPSHHMVAQRGGGCRYCAKNGIDFTLPAFIYLITNVELQAHKIGISGEYSKEDRLLDHAKNGWSLYKKLTFSSADKALKVEQMTLTWLREERGLPPFLSKEQVPQAGWTETVDAMEIDLPSIWSKIEELSKIKK